MAEPENAPAQAPTPPKPVDKRPEHIAAWHDAKTEDERKAAVTKHPKLATIYSEAGKYVTLLIAVLSFLFAFQNVSKGQAVPIFGNGVLVIGTSNSPIFQTNTLYLTMPALPVYLSTVTNTNTVFIGSYMATLSPGGSNLTAIGAFTNSFLTGTNAWSTNIQSMVVPVYVYSVYQAADGTNSVTVFIP